MKPFPHASGHERPQGEGEVLVVALPPAHHPGDLGAMQAVLDGPLDEGKVHLAVDVTTADFVCTTAIGYLVYCIKRARDGGGDVRFYGAGSEPGGSFHKLLELCDVEAMFRIYRDRGAAVASFEAPR